MVIKHRNITRKHFLVSIFLLKNKQKKKAGKENTTSPLPLLEKSSCFMCHHRTGQSSITCDANANIREKPCWLRRKMPCRADPLTRDKKNQKCPPALPYLLCVDGRTGGLIERNRTPKNISTIKSVCSIIANIQEANYKNCQYHIPLNSHNKKKK